MILETKKLNTANALVNGEILLKDLEVKFDKVASKISKSVKIDGFRKGKVPLSVVKARYKDNIEQDAQKEVIEEILQAGIKELGIAFSEVMGNPIVTKFDKKESDVFVEIKLSLKPQFDLDVLSSCVPEVNLAEVTDKQVDVRIQEIAQKSAPLLEAKKDKKVAQDDIVNIDFEGFIDGEVFDGGNSKGFDLTIGSGQFIPGFEDGLIGLEAGSQKDIDVVFPENYQAPNLAGKSAIFKVKINKIQQRDKVKIDDELAKTLLPQEKNASLDLLKEKVREQIHSEEKTKLYNEELKEKLIENFDKTIDFDLPDLIVEQEMDLLFRNFLSALVPDEFEKFKNDAQIAKQKRESFRSDAQKSVKITFIVDAFAKQENILVEDNEVFQAVYYEAMMNGQDPKNLVEYYQKNNLLPAIKMAMIEEKILVYLLDKKLNEKAKNQDSTKASSDTKKTIEDGAKLAKKSKVKEG